MAPEIAGALLAVDATLAGEPADPQYAELAELALLLQADRPAPEPGFTAALDERVQTRFARARSPRRRRSLAWWVGIPAAVAAGLAAVVFVVGGLGHGGGGSLRASPVSIPPATSSTSATAAASSAGSSARAHNGALSGASSARDFSGSSGRASVVPASSVPSTPPGPVGTGNRQVVQSARLQLSTAPSRIDAVAQEVFGVIGVQKGIVQSSNVTATGTPDGSAQFQLSVPSANLAQTLAALSSLHGATVVSRSDATSDITGQVGGAGQRLAEARALRRSLLRQLAAATTTEQTASLTARLHDADASIASDLSTLRGLKRQVAYSQISLTIQASGPGGAAGNGSGGGFTLGRAAHDAGRVLVVVAGGVLIALAVLVPLGLAGALVAWVGLIIRRRRREQSLDLV